MLQVTKPVEKPIELQALSTLIFLMDFIGV